MQTVTYKDIEEVLLKIPKEPGANDNIYTFLHVASQIILLVLHGKLSKDDIKTITLPDGRTAFTEEDSSRLAELLEASGPKLKEIFEHIAKPNANKTAGQSGGGIEKLIEMAQKAYIPPEEISLDHQYNKLTSYLDQLDEQNRELARTLGPVAFISNMKVDPFVILPGGAKLQFPARAILPLINALLELLRIFFSLVPFGRVPRDFLTVFMSLFDIARGEWKYSIFTMLGLFGTAPLLIGVFFKLLRDVWLLIEPRLQKKIRLDLYLATKSIFIGFWLRLTTMFMPDFVRGPLEATFAPFRALLENLNRTMEQIEEKVKVTTEPMGVIVKFPRIPSESIPSLDDIQALQTVISQPEIFCADDFQKIVEPLKAIPPIKLLLEMLNVPMDREMMEAQCQGIKSQDLAGSLVERLMPTVTLIPGGPAAVAADAAKAGMSGNVVQQLSDSAKASVDQKVEEAKRQVTSSLPLGPSVQKP